MKNIKISICADSGYTNFFQNKNSLVLNSKNPNYCFLLGDNFYPFGIFNCEDSLFKEKYENVFPKIPCFAILGNHDYLLNPKAQIEICKKNINPFWKMPFFFYDVILNIDDKNSVHFIFIDTCILAKEQTIKLLTNEMNIYTFKNIHESNYQLQLNWLKQILEQSQSKWKIVCGHYPIYSNGPHQNSTILSSLLLPIFHQYKIDCYISGHDHNLQHIIKDDIHFLICGSFSDCYPFYPETVFQDLTLFSKADYGFLLLEIINENVLQFQFINNEDHILHTFQLIK